MCLCVCRRLCSLAQDAKQETEDNSAALKKSIKPEPATSGEEEEETGGQEADADVKLCNTAEEENTDTKPKMGTALFTTLLECLVFPFKV